MVGEPPKRKLLDRVRDVLRTKHYSYRPEQSYVNWTRTIFAIACLALFCQFDSGAIAPHSLPRNPNKRSLYFLSACSAIAIGSPQLDLALEREEISEIALWEIFMSWDASENLSVAIALSGQNQAIASPSSWPIG